MISPSLLSPSVGSDYAASPIDYDKPLPKMPPPSEEEVYDADKSSESAALWESDPANDASMSSEDLDLNYLRSHPSAALPPSPYDAVAGSRPRAPTPAATPPAQEPSSSPEYSVSTFKASAANGRTSVAVPSALAPLHSSAPLSRSASEPESAFYASRPFTRHPDPSQLPNHYPPRSLMSALSSGPPALSSGASSTSTRSSAYTSSGSAGEYAQVHVASSDFERDPHAAGPAINPDSVHQLLERDAVSASTYEPARPRAPAGRTQWPNSQASSRSTHSTSSRAYLPQSLADGPTSILRSKTSFDDSWQPDERDELGLTTDDEIDDDDDGALEDEDEELQLDDRTAAVVVAEEGRGLIIRGEGMSLMELKVGSGTTHLLVGQSVTPNSMPSFLNSTLPHICDTLLALDISANFLVALPPAVASCIFLEELNIASNPLRALPIFLSNLGSLRVLIADATGITTLPPQLSSLERLDTLSVRRNKMYSLPSWLCLLPSLETLLVDGNPFQGPWQALLQPLMSRVPTTPFYPPSTPFVDRSEATSTSQTTSEADPDEPLEPSSAVEEEHTITPAMTSYAADTSSAASRTRKLERTRTTPSRPYHDRSSPSSPATPGTGRSSAKIADSGYFGESVSREIRRMRSAGDVRRANLEASSAPILPALEATRPAMPHYPASSSSSNLLNTAVQELDPQSVQKRFASLSVSSGSPVRPTTSSSRPALVSAFFEPPARNTSNAEKVDPRATPYASVVRSRPTSPTRGDGSEADGSPRVVARLVKEEKEKQGRWGFFKKMSMAKMKPDPSPGSTRAHHTRELSQRVPSTIPRISTPSFGESEFTLPVTPASRSVSPAPTTMLSASTSSNAMSASGSTSALLPPPLSTGKRSAKRRSFLPIDGPPPLSIPSHIPFTQGLVAANGAGEDSQTLNPMPLESEEFVRREEERAREASARALRSVIAYLRDMYDLGLVQMGTSTQNSPLASMDGGARSRRPILSDGSRALSDASMGSASFSTHPSVSQSPSRTDLRSQESFAHLRMGDASNTSSIASTESNRSSSSEVEDRKYKDDKAKRVVKVREIIDTERTYVKCLQELVDLYVKPASQTVTLLGSKEPLVPSAERRLVFNGVDSLFSFHKDSFLPALEQAAAPLLAPTNAVAESDADGQQSIQVAKAVARVFLSHAAFMRMYSTYINNFDNAVQRVRYWTTERSATVGKSASSSTAQLAGLGLSMSGVTASVLNKDATVAGLGPLTSAQRKRIKSYLKRCRLSPQHSQLNLEGYLLLPVQRVPRYRMLLNELVTSSPPEVDYMDNPLERALSDISSLAMNMNEGKREAEARRQLVEWQSRIRGRFPSPLVQPHRRLIMDGALNLTRVVRKSSVSFDVVNAQGDTSSVQVECLAPELTPRSLIGILCNDLLVLCRDSAEGKDNVSMVDLWAVLRMQTLAQPASIVHGSTLRLVDNKAILYFEIPPSASDALTWSRAINLHIPASKA